MPRLRRPRGRHRPEARARAHAARGALGLRAQHPRRHAALPERDPLGRGPGRHPRLAAVAAQGARRKDNSAAQLLAAWAERRTAAFPPVTIPGIGCRMTPYDLWKTAHALSAAVIFGSGLGIAFF